ncbi:arrestin [Xylariales sp. AK1849]|nr:arrestin [Xylariales sp. AK1849]
MFTSSNSSDAGALSEFQRLTGARPSMTIHLDNHFRNKVYTTSSPLSGHVLIESARDLRFDKLQVMLMGTSKTRLDSIHAPKVTSHTFLKLEMPIPELSYPVPRVFGAGRSYTIPFNFVIPDYLTISACNHDVNTDAVRDHHLCLPPTMGSWLGKDDFSPEMARTDYSVLARVTREAEAGGKRTRLSEASQSIMVLPAYAEQAPLDITTHDELYKMSRSKTLRKSLFSAKTGKITISATQPGAVMISADGRSASSGKAQLELNFESTSSHTLPPSITGVSAKITAMSYYSGWGVSTLPHMGEWNRFIDGRGSYSCTTALCSTPVGKAKWRQHLQPQTSRKSSYSSDMVSDSDRSSCVTDPKPPQNNKGTSPIYHTASLQIPIELPVNKKMFIPSFNSCILSRAYVLRLTVSLSCGGRNSNLTVGVPLQIGVDSTAAFVDSTGLPTFEAAIEETDADAPLRPRTLSVPNVEFERHVLPGYADLAGARVVMAN